MPSHRTWFSFLILAGAARASSQQPAMPTPKVVARLPRTAANKGIIASPDGKVLLMNADTALYRIDRATGALTKLASGDFDDAVWSRDNRLVFDRTDENDDQHIFTVPLDPATGKPTAPPRRVSLSAGDTPVMSPDGKSIAFAKDAKPGQVVAMLPANGGPERALTPGVHAKNPFAWSADGQWIYYDELAGRGNIYTINRVTPSGKNELLVARNVWRPILSADDKYILYRPVEDSVGIATADGRLVATLTIDDRRSGVIAGTPRWLPGNSILFTRSRRGSTVTAVSLGDGRSRVLGDSTTRSVFPSISPDGKNVAALTAVGGRMQLTIRPLAGGALRTIRTLDAPFEAPLAWSPDGRFIAVRTGEVDRPARPVAAGLEIVDVASAKSQRVPTARDVRRVHWSADSRAIRYEHQVMDTAGVPVSMETRETAIGGADKMVRAIDANGGVVFVGYDQVYLIARGQLVDLASGTTRQLLSQDVVPPPLAPGAPRPIPVASPDLQWIAMPTATTGGRPLNTITLVSVKTGERRTIPLPFQAVNPEAGLVWHPDGKHLIVASTNRGGPAHLYLVPLSGEQARIITTVDYSGEGVTTTISPDGGTIVMTRQGAPTVELLELSLAPLIAGAARR